jgi:hypothetical protein
MEQSLSLEARKGRADELIGIVREHLDAASLVAVALDEIRDQKLYVELGYRTWALFTEGELGVGRRRANKIIQEQRASRALRDTNEVLVGTAVPTNEKEVELSGRALQAIAPLVEVDPEAARDLVARLSEGGPVTEQAIRTASRPPSYPRFNAAPVAPAKLNCADWECQHPQDWHEGGRGHCEGRHKTQVGAMCACSRFIAPVSTAGQPAPTPRPWAPAESEGPYEPRPDSRYVRMCRDLMLEFNRPEARMSVDYMAGVPALQEQGIAAVQELRDRLDEVLWSLQSGEPLGDPEPLGGIHAVAEDAKVVEVGSEA